MSHDVFISYASEDRLTADAACHALEARGIRCWIAPRDVPPGRAYPEALVDAIQGAKVMVLVFSASANASRHVPKEVERAASAGIPILPIRIESVRPTKSLLFFLGSVHWLDALTPPVEKALEHLADAVNVLIDATGERKIPPPGPIPSPVPVRTGSRAMLVGAGVIVVLGGLLIWRLTASRSPLPVVGPSPVSPLPGGVPAPGSPLPDKEISQEGLVGRWKWYNGATVTVQADGNFSAQSGQDLKGIDALKGLFVGAWQRSSGPGKYSLIWPEAVDRVTLSADGLRLKGGNQYGILLTAERQSGSPTSLPGDWLWWNGATVEIRSDGTMTAGPFQARWARLESGEFTFTWGSPVDQVTLSPDGQHLSGANQYGFSLTATRIGN